MKRVGLGRCLRRQHDPARESEWDEVRRVDEELDALGARESTGSEDSVLRMLGALAEDVDDEAPPQQSPAPKRRRLISRAALTTGLTIAALSGTGMAAATVMVGGVGPLQPIQQAVEALYDVDQASADGPSPSSAYVSEGDVRSVLADARDALAEGRLAEAQRLMREAKLRWERLDGPPSGLWEAIQALERRIAAAADSGGRPVPGGPVPAPSRSHQSIGQAPATEATPGEDAAAPTAGTTAGEGSDADPGEEEADPGASPTPSDSPTPPTTSPTPSPTSSGSSGQGPSGGSDGNDSPDSNPEPGPGTGQSDNTSPTGSGGSGDTASIDTTTTQGGVRGDGEGIGGGTANASTQSGDSAETDEVSDHVADPAAAQQPARNGPRP